MMPLDSPWSSKQGKGSQMRLRVRRSVALVLLVVVAAAALASVALAGTTSKLPTSAPAAAASVPTVQASTVSPNFIGGVANFVAGYVAGKALDYVVANRVALAIAVEESTFTTIVLATPAGPVNPADVQFDNTNG
jgi:hypothetical protein